MDDRHLNLFLEQNNFNSDDKRPPKPWYLCQDLLGLINEIKLNAAHNYYKQVQTQLIRYPTVWVLATLYIIKVKIKLGIKNFSLNQLETIWSSLDKQDKIYLNDFMAEVQMEVALLKSDKSLISDIFSKYFEVAEDRIHFLSHFKHKKSYYMAKLCDLSGDYNQSCKLLNRAIEECQNSIWKMKMENYLGISYGKLSKFHKATKIFADLLKETTSKSNSYIRAQVFNNLSIIANIQSDTRQANRYSQYCLDLCNKYNFGQLKYYIMYNQASTLSNQGNYYDALTIFKFLEQEHEDLKNYQLQTRIIIAITAILAKTGQFQSALVELDRLKTSYQLMSANLKVTVELNKVDLLLQLGKFEKVKSELESVEEDIIQISSRYLNTKFKLLKVKYRVYGKLELPDTQIIDEIITYAKSENDHNILAVTRYLKANIQEMQGDLLQANVSINKAIEHAEYIKNPIMLSRFYFYKINLLILTNELDHTSDALQSLQSLQHRYPYVLIKMHFIAANLMLHLQLNLDVNHSIGDSEMIEQVFEEVIRNEFGESMVKTNLLEFLLDKITETSDSDIPFYFWNEITSSLKSIATKTGSMYLLAQLLIAEAHLSSLKGKNVESENLLDHARNLLLNIGSNRRLDSVTYHEISISQQQFV